MKRYEQCILATCSVPWDEDGRITGVFYETMIAGGAKPMVGIISLSLQTVIERIERSHEIGVRSFQLSLPSWGECTFSEIRHFFAETCGRFEDCSFLHYNCPRSRRMLSPDESGMLAGEFPNLVATKNGAGSPVQIVSLARKAPQLQHFLTEFNFAAGCLLGVDVGLLISVASIHWKRAKLFYRACRDRQIQEVDNYVAQLEEIHYNLFRIVGQQGHIDGVYDKLFSKMADPRFPLRLLPPYSYAKEESFFEFVNDLRENHPEWIDEASIMIKERI